MSLELDSLPEAAAARAVSPTPAPLRLALPKGRQQDQVISLLADAGVSVAMGGRAYRPTVSLPAVETKLLKPQNVVEMLGVGATAASPRIRTPEWAAYTMIASTILNLDEAITQR